MREEQQNKVLKYKELYDLSKEIFYEELSRSQRIDEKASKYLTMLTFLLGIFASLNGKLLYSVLPPNSLIEWLLIIISSFLVLFMVIAWFYLFQVLKIHDFKKIPIDIGFFDKYKLTDVYYGLSKGIKENLKINRGKGDIKSRRLYIGYILIRIIVFLLIIFSFISITHLWINSKNNNKGEKITMASKREKPEHIKPQNSNETLPEESPEEVNSNVIPPTFDIVTEGFDPSKIQKEHNVDKTFKKEK